MTGNTNDICDLMRIRTELQNRHWHLKAILDAIPAYVGHVDPDERILFANRAFGVVTGHSAEDLVGRPLREVLGAAYPGLRPYVLAALQGKASESIHEFSLTNGQKRLVMVQRVPDRGPDGRASGYFAIRCDVTDRTRAEVAQREQERRLRDALIAEVHHRLRNNLQSIVALLRLEVEKHVELSDLLEPTITKLLAVSVGFELMGAGAKSGLNVCDMTRQIAHRVAEITEARIDVKVDRRMRKTPVRLGAHHAVNVALVLNEIMLNAVKHAPSGLASVTVSVHVMQGECKAAIVRVFSPGARLPAKFDFDTETGLGTGLGLIRQLMPAEIAKLRFETGPEGVAVELRLESGLPEPMEHARRSRDL